MQENKEIVKIEDVLKNIKEEAIKVSNKEIVELVDVLKSKIKPYTRSLILQKAEIIELNKFGRTMVMFHNGLLEVKFTNGRKRKSN